MANIELNVVALGDFKGLETQLGALQTQINAMNAELASGAASITAKQMAGLSNAFNQSMMSSGLFTSKLVSMSTAAQHLGERIQKSHTTMTDYKNAMKSVSDQSNIYNQLAQRQVGMQQAIVQSMGGGMARVFAQHNVDLTEASVRSKVFTEAILAQKAALNQSATQIINWGKNMQWAGRQLTAGLTMPVALFAAGIAKMYNEVDVNLTKLAKVYGVGLEKPTQATLNAVRKDVLGLSKELGHQLGISAAEVSDTAAQFAAAGLTGKSLIGATEQASRMVVLGEVDKQKAITATIALQTAYKLNTQQVTEATNFFNAAQAATSTSMADLVDAIPAVGPVIQGLGGSYKDMVAILTAMKEGGVPASEAANAIKNSMGRIINPTKAAQEQLKGFGIDITGIVNRNAGNLIGTLTDLQNNLDKLSSLDRQKAISELFGKFQFARMAAFMDNFNKTGTQSAKVVEMMGMSAADLAAIADDQTKKIQQSASGRFKIAIQDLKNSLLPMGEAALNMFSKIVEGITKFADKIDNLPGPIKAFLKIFGGLAIVTGPVIMLVGLFGNLMGQIAKGLVNIRTFGTALMNIKNGVNPITILGKSFNLLTEEMIAEENAAKIFGDTMEKNVSPISAVTTAIQELIAAMKQLQTTSLTAATQKVQASAEMAGQAMSRALFTPVMTPGNKNAKENAHHILPYSVWGNTGLHASGETRGVGGTGMETGSMQRMFPIGAVATSSNAGIIQRAMGDESFMIAKQKNVAQAYAELEAKIRAKIAAQTDMSVSEEQIQGIVQELIYTEEEFLAIEKTRVQALQVMNGKTKREQAIRDAIFAENEKFWAGSQSIAETENNIAALLDGVKIKSKAWNDAMTILADDTLTVDQREKAIANILANTEKEAGKFQLQTSLSQRKLSQLGAVIGYTAESQVKIAAKTNESSIIQDEILQAKAEELEATREGVIAQQRSNGVVMQQTGMQRVKSIMSGGGLAMGASMAGGMMMGSSNKAVANAGTGLMFGGMAASMAPMLGLTGPQGLALGAVVALTIAMKKAYDESERLRKGLTQTFAISDVAAQEFGITIRNLSDVQLGHLIGTTQQAKDTVSKLAEAYKQATGKTKDYIDSIKNMTDAGDISNAMIKKFYTDLASGLNVEQAKQDIAAILREAGKEDYAVDIKLKIDKVGFVNGPVDAFKKSISDLTDNGAFADIKSLKDQQTALRQQFANDPTNTYLAQQISMIGNELAGLSESVVKDSDALSTAITNAFNVMSVKDFRSAITEIGPAFTENEPAIQSFIKSMEKTNPEMAGYLSELHNQGAAWADVLTAAQLVADGTITSIEEMRLAAKEPIVLDYYIQKHETAVEQGILSSQKKGIASSLTSKASGVAGSGSGGSGNGKSAIDKEIQKNKDLIDLIKKQMEERKKLIDLQNRELEFSKTKMGLENQIRDALAEGNFLKAAELQQQLKVEESKKSEEDKQRALDAADQARIDSLEKKNKELENKKKNSGSGGSTKTGKASDGTSITSVTDALDAFSQKMAGSTLDQFLNTKEVQSYIDQLTKLGVPYEDAKQAAIKYHDVARTSLFALAGDYETAHKEIFDKLASVSTEFAGKEQAAKDLIQQDIESIVLNPMWDNTEKIDKLSKYLVTNLKMGPNEAKAAAQSFLDSFNGKVDLTKLADIENKYKAVGSAARDAMIKQRAVAILARNPELTSEKAWQMALDESRGHKVGGLINGPGTGTSDSIPAMLSNGEYVIRASAVSKYGSAVMDAINNGTFNLSPTSSPTFNIPGAASNLSSAHSTNNATINAEFHISGADPKTIADEVMHKLHVTMKKSGSVNRF